MKKPRIRLRKSHSRVGDWGAEHLERRVLLSSNMLAFSAAPVSTNAGSWIDSPGGVQVTVENSTGQRINTSSDSITVAIGTNPGAASLGGTLTAQATNGIATFANLLIGAAANGYTLTAADNTAPTTAAATSSLFNVDAIPSFIALGALSSAPVGYSPQSDLVRDSSGNLYGTTFSGGAYGYGCVYELSGTGYSTFTSLVSFTGYGGAAPGANPDAGLVIDSSGNLYGTASAGGALNDGTVFELSGTSHTTYSTLVSFTGTTGSFPGQAPEADLTIAGNGIIYGTTAAGGTSGNGNIFTLSGASHITFTSMLSFTGTSGSYLGTGSATPLVFYNGEIFGATQYGGTNGFGNVFELSGSNYSTFTNLMNFTGYTGSDLGTALTGNLIFDSSGDIFGTTRGGGTGSAGTVFELTGTNYATFTSILSFTGTSGKYLGGAPNAGLAVDSAGNFYGSTESGGTGGNLTLGGDGTVFELSGTGHATFTSVVSFTGTTTSANKPYAGLILDSSGDIFATSQGGGAYGYGAAFELPASNHSSASILASFSSASGVSPAPLIQDSSGNLYGTTPNGGAYSDGTVFELSGATHSIYTTLATFTGNSGTDIGSEPTGIAFDASGNILGTTYIGGTNGLGSIFELSGTSYSTFNLLFSFTGTSGLVPGADVDSGLALDSSSGNLYGSTIGGGTANLGTAFAISGTTHSTFTSLVSFTGTTGSYLGESPRSAPVPDSSDNLYGTTAGGGASNYGTVYELSGSTHTTFTSLTAFTGSSGAQIGGYPDGGLIFDSSGNIYGASAYGGTTYGDGMIYELAAPNHNVLTTVVPFTGVSGNAPGGQSVVSLTVGGDGTYYGDTSIGGTSNDGTVFSLSGTNHSTYTLLASFTGSSGYFPGRDAFEAVTLDNSGNLYGTTPYGGAYGYGSIYEIPKAGIGNLNQAGGSVTIASPASVGSINGIYFNAISVGSGATVSLAPNSSTPWVLTTNSLTLAGTTNAFTGTLDLTNNDLDIPGASLATTVNQILQGYNNGRWNGNGITSSSAANSATHLTALGVIQNNQNGSALFTAANTFDGTVPGASDILVKYTYYGDTNLDGKVDGSDYSRIDNGYLNHLTGWFNGDFNYDGVVNGSDYTLIDNAFNTQGASLAAQTAIVPRGEAVNANRSTGRPAWSFSQSQISVLLADSQVNPIAAPDGVAAEIFTPAVDELHLKRRQVASFLINQEPADIARRNNSRLFHARFAIAVRANSIALAR